MPTVIKLEKGIKIKPEVNLNETPFYKCVQEYLASLEANEADVITKDGPWNKMFALRVGEDDYGVSLIIGLEMGEKEDPVLTLETAIGIVGKDTDLEGLNRRITILNGNTGSFPVSYLLNEHNQVVVRFSMCACGGVETARFVLNNLVGLSLSNMRWLKKECNLKPFYSKEAESTEENLRSGS